MFTTIEQVKELTDYDVDAKTITMAQSIIEAYVGRLEIEVTNASDVVLLGRATAYQAAYMLGNSEAVFEQMNAYQISQFGQMVTFQASNVVAPWVAPLSVLACQRLSWKRIRSVKTGTIFSQPVPERTWETT